MVKEAMTDLLKQAVSEAMTAGQSLRGIAMASGLRHPPLLRFLRGEQSLRLDKAEMLADYLGIECFSLGSEATRTIALLTDPGRVQSWQQLEGGSAVPKAAGLYGVWFAERSLPSLVPVHNAVSTDTGTRLLYVGISPGKPGSKKALRDRLKTHFTGSAGSSTLRKSVGCLFGYPLLSGGLGPREAELSEWMATNASVTWAEVKRPWRYEGDVLRCLDLPLNLEGNGRHPFYEQLFELRRQAARKGT